MKLAQHTKSLIAARIRVLLKTLGESKNWQMRIYPIAEFEVCRGTAENTAIKIAFEKVLGVRLTDSDFIGIN